MIKNIIFDIGNVLINWNPAMIVKESFSNHPDQESLTTALFKSQIWYDLNLGNLTIKDAIIEYNTTLGLDIVVLNKIMSNLFNSLTPINETIALLKKLYALGIPLYSITDNVPELIEYEKNKIATYLAELKKILTETGSSDINFQNKYLKYKTKYLKLKTKLI
jgi:putative hydrolase of the HAD superfamily